MKVLIFVLLAALTAEAQSVADLARQERGRRSQSKTVRVFTSADARSGVTPAAEPASSPKETAKSSDTPKAEPKAKPADPLQEWTAQVEQIRASIRSLQDEETALQLQVNDLTNQVYAPITNLGAKSQAQAALAETQSRLVEVRKDLAQTRLKLQQMEAQGPPKSEK
jgi:hypothetical protein